MYLTYLIACLFVLPYWRNKRW